MRRTTPPVYLDLWEGRVEHDRVKRLPGRLVSYSSGDFKQQGTSAYNLNVLSVNCEQDWKV